MAPTQTTAPAIRAPVYPALLCLGVTLGAVGQNAAANATGMASGRVYVATFLLLPLALLGARLLYVVTHRDSFRTGWWRVLDRSVGGMALYGGMAVMLPASVAVLAALDVPYWSFWDVTIFLILPAMVCTRVGCLLHGCCAGRVTASRFGLRSWDASGDPTRRLPTQLLEAGAAAILLAVAVAIGPATGRPGELFGLVALGYGAARLFLQPLRSEPGRVTGQLPSLAVVVLALTALAHLPG